VKRISTLLVAVGMSSCRAGIAVGQCDSMYAPFTLDNLRTFQFGTSGGTDCWGWAAPDGHEYARMGTSYGVHFVNASAMQVVDSVQGRESCGSTWRDIKTYGFVLPIELTGLIDILFSGQPNPQGRTVSQPVAISTATVSPPRSISPALSTTCMPKVKQRATHVGSSESRGFSLRRW
jgi:hypothetical protein